MRVRWSSVRRALGPGLTNQGKTARAIAETWPQPVVLVALAPPATAAVSSGTMSLVRVRVSRVRVRVRVT